MIPAVYEHYSAEEVRLPLRIAPSRLHHKPNGFWLSVPGEDDWPSWCRAEDFCLEKLAVCHEVRLSPDANILHLTTLDEIVEFTEEYGQSSRSGGVWEIAWRRVTPKFDGIVIAPYSWTARYDERTLWYNTWDCASGCVWNPEAIASLRVKEPADVAY